MRVTKIIREYVEKKINSALTYGKPSEDYKAAAKELSDLANSLNERVEAYAKELLEASTTELPEGFYIKRSAHSVFTHGSYNSPLHCAAIAHEKEVRQRRAEAIENILVELELGATKADLERLIAEAIK